MAYTVVGESKAHAEEREQLFLNDLVDPMASLTLLSELMNYDFSGLSLDAPITDELIESVSGIRGLVQNIKAHIGGDTVTLGDLAGHRATCCRGRASSAPARGRRPDGGVVRRRRLRRLRHRRHALAGRLRGRRPPGRARAAAPGPCSATATPGSTLRDTSRARAPRVSRTVPDRPAAEGLRVVIDAATLAAGPMVATALGEFGAEVIKVEQPGAGDPLRTWGDQKDGIGLFWKSMSRNKRCVTLDLRAAEGQELFHRLLDVSDVLVVNNRPSALARWGLDYESVHGRTRDSSCSTSAATGGAGRRATARVSARWPRP
jgi:hypothetical protein